MIIAFISDIHSNLEAFKAVLDKIDSLEIKNIYSIGDVIGYNANPNECIELIKQRNISSVLGNHEWAVLHEDTSWFNPVAAESNFWTIDNLKEKNFAWLKKLPEKINTKISDYKILLVHGSPSDPVFEYVYEEDVNENFVKGYDIILTGHTHVPFIKKVKNCLVINCGAVGQPRDGNNKSSFVVFDTITAKAETIRVDYDIKTAAGKIIKAGLPSFLAQRLFTGV